MVMTIGETTLGTMMIGKRSFRVLSLFCALFLGLVLVASTPPAYAQEKRNPQVIELEGIDVIGKVVKPEVFYILGRSTIRYEQLKLDQSFVSRIVASARSNPF